jgi:hypothetical protein
VILLTSDKRILLDCLEWMNCLLLLFVSVEFTLEGIKEMIKSYRSGNRLEVPFLCEQQGLIAP